MGGTSKRIFGYDLAKCIAMFLVVTIHYIFYVPLFSNTFFNNAFSVLTCLGVPLFFTVNGALLFMKPFSLKRHYVKTLKIIGIVVLWEIISSCIMGLLLGKSPLDGGLVAYFGYVLFGSLDGFNLGHFWFMKALIALYLVFPVLKICFDSPKGKIALGILLACVMVLTVGVNFLDTFSNMLSFYFGLPRAPTENIGQLSLFGNYGYTLIYFIGGGLLAANRRVITTKAQGKLIPFSLMLFGLSWIALFMVQRFQAVSTGVAFYVQDGYWNVFVVLMTLSAFLVLTCIDTQKKGIRKVVESIGNNTLGIYFVHMISLTIASMVLGLRFQSLPFVWNIAAIIAVFFGSYIVALLGSKIPLIKILFKM